MSKGRKNGLVTSSINKQNNRAPGPELEGGAVEGVARGGVLVRVHDDAQQGPPVMRHAEVGDGGVVAPPDVLRADHSNAVLLDHEPAGHRPGGCRCCQDRK